MSGKGIQSREPFAWKCPRCGRVVRYRTYICRLPTGEDVCHHCWYGDNERRLRKEGKVKTYRVEGDVLVKADIPASSREDAIERFRELVVEADSRHLTTGHTPLTLSGDSVTGITVNFKPCKDEPVKKAVSGSKRGRGG